MENDNEEEIKKYETLLEMQKTLFQFQDNSDNNTDSKLSVYLALCGAIIIGVLSLDNKNLLPVKENEQLIGIIFMILASIVFCYGMHTKKYHDPFVGVNKLKTNLSYKDTLMQLLSDCAFATNRNNSNLTKKVRSYKFGLGLLFLGLIFISLSLVDIIIIYL